MTDEQRQRIWEIENSCDGRTELAERIVGLEDELAEWEKLTAGIELPEYPITQFQPKDLERENAKLRELVQRMRRYMVGAIEHCGYDTPTTGYTMLGSRLEECEDAMRELGMELDG